MRAIFKIGFLLAVTALTPASAQQAAQTSPAQPQPLPPTDTAAFARLPVLNGPVLAPDGKRVAAKLGINGKEYFGILDGATSQPVLVGLGDFDLNWWRWVNDEWLVVGVSTMVPMQGDEWRVTRALGVNATTGKFVPLFGRSEAQFADDVLWIAQDGSPRILMTSQRSTDPFHREFWPQVDEVDVSTGRRKMVLGPRGGIIKWYADASGTVRMGTGGGRIAYRSNAKSAFRNIDNAFGGDGSTIVPSLFLAEPDKALAFDDDEHGYSALYEIDLAKMERGKKLFGTPGYDLGGGLSNPDGLSFDAYITQQQSAGVLWVNPEMKALHAKISGKVAGGGASIISTSRDRSKAIVRVGSANAPGAYILFDAKSDGTSMLAHVNDDLRMRRLHPVSTIRYKARDGLVIEGVLTLPRGKNKNLPLIVLPHGGPFARDIEKWDWWTQFLADRGYAVIQPNYRGSSGYGTAFAQEGEGQWGLAMQDDLNDAVRELARLGIADPKRVCMVGASYGGYAAFRAAQRDGALYRCAISYAGVSDLNRMVSDDSAYLYAHERRKWVKKQAPDLSGVSPLNFPGQFSIPMLIVHGALDRVVRVSHSKDMAAKLQGAGKDVTYIEQPEGDHHFSREADRLQFLKAMEAFLAKHNPA